jgi:hypothetical protein
MKKFVVLALFGLLIMAFSGMAYAQKLEFRASGSIDFDTTVNQNVPCYFGNVAGVHTSHGGIFQTWSTPSFNGLSGKPDRGLDHSTAYAYSRGLLKFDAVIDKNLSGTIYFEMDAYRWGGSPGWTSATTTGKGGALGLGSAGGTWMQGSERNTMGVWTTDRAAVEVKNVYFDVGLPYFGIPAPMTVRIGAQPFGVRPQICVYSDGAGITGGIQIDPITIIPMWAKINEGLDWAADDADLYGLHVNAKVSTFTVGAYGLYYNMNTYPLTYSTAVSFASIPALSPWGTTVSSSYGLYEAGTQRSNMWWLGVYADGKAGPVNLNFDFVYDTGKVERKLLFDSGGTATPLLPNGLIVPSVDYRGWATRLKVDFPWEKFNFGIVGMYASGADANKTSIGGLAGDSVANRIYGSNPAYPASSRVSSYVTPPGSEQSPGANESIVMYSSFNAVADGGTGISNISSYAQMSKGGFGGTAFFKGYGSIKLAPWYKVTLQGLYIWDTTKHGNTFGTAVKNPSAPWMNQILRDNNDIGFELDLIQEIDVYKNLKGYIGMGYLWAGKAMDVLNITGATVPPFPVRNISPANPWNITTRLLYTF